MEEKKFILKKKGGGSVNWAFKTIEVHCFHRFFLSLLLSVNVQTTTFPLILITWGLNHLPYLVSIVSMAVIKDCSTNYIKAIGLNQAYTMLLKLRNNYNIALICSFGSIPGIYYSYKQKV